MKCNKVVNVLLNGNFFKCVSCKVLVKITSTELITPEENTFKNDPSYLFKSEFADTRTSSYKKLFHNDNYLSFNQFIPDNKKVAGESFFQTPKNNNKSTFVSSQDDIFKTPSNNYTTGNLFLILENIKSVRKINKTFYTPRGISRFNNAQVFEELPIKEFESKLNLPTSQYSLYINTSQNKTRMINPISESKGKFYLTLANVFSGYNKTERSKSPVVSKSRLNSKQSRNISNLIDCTIQNN